MKHIHQTTAAHLIRSMIKIKKSFDKNQTVMLHNRCEKILQEAELKNTFEPKLNL
jgi:hypothetical protein